MKKGEEVASGSSASLEYERWWRHIRDEYGHPEPVARECARIILDFQAKWRAPQADERKRVSDAGEQP